MDNQQIREILESLIKNTHQHPLENVVSQDKIDKLIEDYYKEQKENDKKA